MAEEITKEIRQQLRTPFPSEAITPHPTKKYLSTLKAAFVMERLNDVFGICGWTIEHDIISDDPDYVVVGGCIYLSQFDLRTPRQYGGHGKTGTNTEPADGYKSAVTDLMSKCASYLEIGIDVFKGMKIPPSLEPSTKKAAPKTKAVESTDLAGKKSDLFAFIAEKKGTKGWSPKTIHGWLVNVCKISTERIDSDPEGVLKEVAKKEGWEL